MRKNLARFEPRDVILARLPPELRTPLSGITGFAVSPAGGKPGANGPRGVVSGTL